MGREDKQQRHSCKDVSGDCRGYGGSMVQICNLNLDDRRERSNLEPLHVLDDLTERSNLESRNVLDELTAPTKAKERERFNSRSEDQKE